MCYTPKTSGPLSVAVIPTPSLPPSWQSKAGFHEQQPPPPTAPAQDQGWEGPEGDQTGHDTSEPSHGSVRN